MLSTVSVRAARARAVAFALFLALPATLPAQEKRPLTLAD